MGTNNHSKRVCLVPNVSGVGGMVSFRGKLIKGLSERGIGISIDLNDTPYSAILVIGGTRDLPGLWRLKRCGVRIVQRLDGMNWIHRERRTGWRHFLRAEYGNFILSQIRYRLADHIVYQSQFSREWWERVYGATRTPSQVVYNGVDLERYTPSGVGEIPKDLVRILLVEGSIAGGYEWGLETAIHMAERLKNAHSHNIEVMVVGRVSELLQREWKEISEIKLSFKGQVPAESVPELDRSAHVLYAADINPACPNSVIEAMACGLPVVAFDTGALSELIKGDAGKLVPFGGDHWKLESPDIDGLAEAANIVINNQADYRAAARNRAVEAFGLDQMIDGYLDALIL
jgi:glycosyltransferase involved in cell wall biosynthesis